MTIARRLAALERRADRATAPMLEAMADGVLATLAEAEGSDPLPERGAVLAALRRGDAVACRSHLIRRSGDELLIRHYPGVDLALLSGERRE